MPATNEGNTQHKKTNNYSLLVNEVKCSMSPNTNTFFLHKLFFFFFTVFFGNFYTRIGALNQ